MQIVTKLPNENIQNYQLEMFDSRGGGGKLLNANCDQTTKWKIFEIESGRPFFTACRKTFSSFLSFFTKIYIVLVRSL